MNLKKRRFIIILPLLAIIILCVGMNINIMNSNKSSVSLSEFIEQGEHEGLSLTIYYLTPIACTLVALSVDELIYGDKPPRKKNEIHGRYNYKIIISDTLLEDEIFDILNQLANTDLIPVENETRVDARIYYVFKNKKGQKIYDVAMWGYTSNSVFVNGLEAEWNDIFSEVIMPFLPEDDARVLETYVFHLKPL